MSTSIRPGGPVAPGTTAIEGSSGSEPSLSVESSAATERAAVTERATASGGVTATQAAQVEATAQPDAALLRRLDAGEVTREQAIEGLVNQALEAHGGARLPESQRAELESVLRAALHEDPALARLLGGDELAQ